MLYLTLFHGRDSLTEPLDDWGYDGPTLGPLEYVHTTYGVTVHVRLASGDELDLCVVGGCIEYEGKYYGDWSVFGKPQEA